MIQIAFVFLILGEEYTAGDRSPSSQGSRRVEVLDSLTLDVVLNTAFHTT